MKKYLILLVFNIILTSLLFYTFFLSNKEIKMYILNDVSGLNYEDGLRTLDEFEIGIEYIESTSPQDTIIYTVPSAGKAVYEGQMIKVYVSKGYNREVYQNLINELYENKKLYLLKLVNEYQIDLEIVYKKDDIMVDGLIYNVELEDEFIDINDKIIITIISNSKTVVIPDFIGWYYTDVVRYCRENQINLEFLYIEIPYPVDFVVGQNIKPHTEVLKNSNPVIVYLAKEN